MRAASEAARVAIGRLATPPDFSVASRLSLRLKRCLDQVLSPSQFLSREPREMGSEIVEGLVPVGAARQVRCEQLSRVNPESSG